MSSERSDRERATLYRMGGVNLRDFADSWLEGLERDNAVARGLLAHVVEGYDYGAHFMMANIGPVAMRDGASREEVLVYAALAAYQNDEFPGSTEWSTARDHLERALRYAQQIGDSAVAKSLLMSVVSRSTRERSDWSQKAVSNSLDHDPARIAAHDQDMESIEVRDVRAAALLDPTMTVDRLLLDGR